MNASASTVLGQTGISPMPALLGSRRSLLLPAISQVEGFKTTTPDPPGHSESQMLLAFSVD